MWSDGDKLALKDPFPPLLRGLGFLTWDSEGERNVLKHRTLTFIHYNLLNNRRGDGSCPRLGTPAGLCAAGRQRFLPGC